MAGSFGVGDERNAARDNPSVVLHVIANRRCDSQPQGGLFFEKSEGSGTVTRSGGNPARDLKTKRAGPQSLRSGSERSHRSDGRAWPIEN